MIIVVGQPLYGESEAGATVDGLPARVGLAAAARGRSVQLVGKAAEDEAGDAVVLALARGGVGHVALLREAGRATPRTVPVARDHSLDAAETMLSEFEEDEVEAPGIAPANLAPSEGTTLDGADVDLALRYLTEFAVLVLADPAEADVVRVAVDAASWVGAQVILVVAPGQTIPDGLPADVIVFEAPEADPDGVFAAFVGTFAAALDDGEDPGDAFRSSIEAKGWAVSNTP